MDAGAGARSPVDSDSSLPGLMSVNRGKKETQPGQSSEIEANLKVTILLPQMF